MYLIHFNSSHTLVSWRCCLFLGFVAAGAQIWRGEPHGWPWQQPRYAVWRCRMVRPRYAKANPLNKRTSNIAKAHCMAWDNNYEIHNFVSSGFILFPKDQIRSAVISQISQTQFAPSEWHETTLAEKKCGLRQHVCFPCWCSYVS